MTSNVTSAGLVTSSWWWREGEVAVKGDHQGGDDVRDGCLQSQQGDFVPWDNPDNIVSKETELWISMAIAVVGIPLLWVLGLVGNTLSAAVFYRQGLSSRINVCLFCLAVVDLLSVTVLFLSYFEAAYRQLVGPINFFITYLVGLTGFSLLSQLVSAVIACERCFCVVSPLKAQRLFSTRTMTVFLGVTSFLLLGGFLAVVGHKHTMACVTDPLTNVSTDIVYVTRYYLDNQVILDIFDVFVFSMAFPAIFLILIVVSTVVTASKLQSAAQWRQQTVYDVSSGCQATSTAGVRGAEHHSAVTTKKKAQPPKAQRTGMALKEVALTRMLMATSLLFVVCLTPSLVVQVATFLLPQLRYNGRYHNFITLLWAVVSFCRVLNSSLNFFVYYLMGSRFRDTLRALLPCWTPTGNSGTRSASQGHMDDSSHSQTA